MGLLLRRTRFYSLVVAVATVSQYSFLATHRRIAQAESTWVPGSVPRWFTLPKMVIHPWHPGTYDNKVFDCSYSNWRGEWRTAEFNYIISICRGSKAASGGLLVGHVMSEVLVNSDWLVESESKGEERCHRQNVTYDCSRPTRLVLTIKCYLSRGRNVCLSNVHLSVTIWKCVKTANHIVELSRPRCSLIFVISGTTKKFFNDTDHHTAYVDHNIWNEWQGEGQAPS